MASGVKPSDKPDPPSGGESQDKLSPDKKLEKFKFNKVGFNRNKKKLLRHAHKFIISRLDNLSLIRTEVAGWLALVAFLIILAFAQANLSSHNIVAKLPVDGGTYAEGTIGKISTINPLYAATDRERAASKLVYSALFDYDETGNLRPELAESYKTSSDGKTYTVKLRSNVYWSDGQPFSADDVIKTVGLIKDPNVESTLYSSWKSVEAKKVDNATVDFYLKNSFASFPLALNFGILPNHVVKDISSSNIRSFSADNVTKIVGTGPFVYSSKESISGGQSLFHFVANEKYFRGEPRVGAFNVQTYSSSNDLLNGFTSQQINAAAGLNVSNAKDSLKLKNAQLLQLPTADGIFALFNNSSPIMSDKNVREALRLATDRDKLRSVAALNTGESIDLSMPEALDTPMIPSLVNGTESLKQPDYNEKAATDKLDAAGWKLNANKEREKNGEAMTIDMVTLKDSNYAAAADSLAAQWQQLGIKVNVTQADPDNVQQNYFVTRGYDVLVYQLHLGADPDVYAYWGSSQANARGLNLSDYKSALSDLALVNARSQTDKAKRDARYIDFAKHWLDDVPAIALYRPNYYYLKSEVSVSLDENYQLMDTAARFGDVQNWTAITKTKNKTP